MYPLEYGPGAALVVPRQHKHPDDELPVLMSHQVVPGAGLPVAGGVADLGRAPVVPVLEVQEVDVDEFR